MTTTPTRRGVLAATAALAALGLAACGGSSDPLATSGPGSAAASSGGAGGSAAAGTVVVGSANFPESELLMNIYAGALKAKGVTVSTKPGIGNREAYLPALEKGEITVMPEYTGALALYLDKTSTAKTSDEVYAALKKSLPAGLTVLQRSAAEDKDSVVVTKETADKYHLTAIGDLAPVAGQLVLGGPPEWPKRPTGTPGLTKEYGVTFKEFKPLDVGGPLTVQALKNGQVHAANLFSTDPSIAANGFVVLDDPKVLFTPQNVVPVVSKAAASDGRIGSALDAVSAKLDTTTLTDLVKKVVVDHQDSDAVAGEWLKGAGLGG